WEASVSPRRSCRREKSLLNNSSRSIASEDNSSPTIDAMPNQALLISVRPRFAEMIFAGTKVVELRRLRPRIGTGDLVFVYVSSPVMALAGAFEVGEVVSGAP